MTRKTGYIIGDTEARDLLRAKGISRDHVAYDRCLRIARAFFAFDLTGSVALRNALFGQLLAEAANRERENVQRDRGKLAQKLNRRKDMTERPWLTDFTRLALRHKSALAAAREVKRIHNLAESADAIRKQAHRLQLVAPRKHRRKNSWTQDPTSK